MRTCHLKFMGRSGFYLWNINQKIISSVVLVLILSCSEPSEEVNGRVEFPPIIQSFEPLGDEQVPSSLVKLLLLQSTLSVEEIAKNLDHKDLVSAYYQARKGYSDIPLTSNRNINLNLHDVEDAYISGMNIELMFIETKLASSNLTFAMDVEKIDKLIAILKYLHRRRGPLVVGCLDILKQPTHLMFSWTGNPSPRVSIAKDLNYIYVTIIVSYENELTVQLDGFGVLGENEFIERLHFTLKRAIEAL